MIFRIILQYFVLNIDAIGKSIPGELYCLSSEPLSKKEYFLNLIFNFLNVSIIAVSEGVFSYFEGMQGILSLITNASQVITSDNILFEML